MTDWTSDANEALTLSLGMHLRHKCQNTLAYQWPKLLFNSEVAGG